MEGRRGAGLGVWLGLGLWAAGCGTTTLEARARQPNPLNAPKETLLESSRLAIDVRDAELPSYVLRNTAYFQVVSRDRLRFHIALTHKWQEMTDVSGWSVYLEDDQGHRYQPEAKEKRYTRHLTRMTDVDRRSIVTDNPVDPNADIQAVNNDGYLRRVPFTSVDLFRGEGDFVFHARNLMNPKVRRLALVMKRAGTELRYVWEFDDTGPTRVDNHGAGSDAPSPTAPGPGRTVLPGPLTGGR